MRVIEQTIYKYSELDDHAKQRAREWFSSGGYTWIDEGIDSIKAFCSHYNVTLKDYSLSPYSYSYIKTDAENQNFRGVTLKQVEAEKDLNPTGYCVDCTLFITMYESMRDNGGNALAAFHDAIEAAKRDIISDMEWQDSEECISELMAVNDYEFDEMGRIA